MPTNELDFQHICQMERFWGAVAWHSWLLAGICLAVFAWGVYRYTKRALVLRRIERGNYR